MIGGISPAHRPWIRLLRSHILRRFGRADSLEISADAPLTEPEHSPPIL